MRVLVTGSRTWPDEFTVYQQLNLAASECRDTRFIVRHGGAYGADNMAHAWCVMHPVFGFGIVVVEEIYRPDWAGRGKFAGWWRNRLMVDDGEVDLCLAFIHQGSKGASHCAGYAESRGVPVRRFEP